VSDIGICEGSNTTPTIRQNGRVLPAVRYSLEYFIVNSSRHRPTPCGAAAKPAVPANVYTIRISGMRDESKICRASLADPNVVLFVSWREKGLPVSNLMPTLFTALRAHHGQTSLRRWAPTYGARRGKTKPTILAISWKAHYRCPPKETQHQVA
jgi:hypothetical protein